MTNTRTIAAGILFCAGLSIGSSVWAANETDLRQQLFQADKDTALTDFSKTKKHACIKAFTARYHSQYTISEALAFNEGLSRSAYDRLFWKGNGGLQRGLIFTAAVNDKSGTKAGNLVCYYATTNARLDFQSAYVMPLQAQMASNVNFSSKR